MPLRLNMVNKELWISMSIFYPVILSNHFRALGVEKMWFLKCFRMPSFWAIYPSDVTCTDRNNLCIHILGGEHLSCSLHNHFFLFTCYTQQENWHASPARPKDTTIPKCIFLRNFCFYVQWPGIVSTRKLCTQKQQTCIICTQCFSESSFIDEYAEGQFLNLSVFRFFMPTKKNKQKKKQLFSQNVQCSQHPKLIFPRYLWDVSLCFVWAWEHWQAIYFVHVLNIFMFSLMPDEACTP